jgi:type II secretory pathway component GspD/PulD (secretin)
MLFLPQNGYSTQPKGVCDPTITLRLEEMPFEQVLKQVSQQTHLSFRIDDNLAQKKISGNFVENDVETFIAKCLRGQNYSAIHDEASNTLTIRTFGEKNNQLVDISHSKSTDDSPIIDVDLSNLQAQETLLYNNYINKPQSIEPLTGMSLQDISLLQKKENNLYDQYVKDPDSVEPITGLKNQEITSLHKIEKDFYSQQTKNPKTAEPLTGIKLQDITLLHQKENELYNEYINNPLTAEPLTGDIIERSPDNRTL